MFSNKAAQQVGDDVSGKSLYFVLQPPALLLRYFILQFFNFNL